MTQQETITAERHEARLKYRALVERVAPIVAKYRVGDFLAMPPIVTQCKPRLACPVCGHGIGRAECKNWKAQTTIQP